MNIAKAALVLTILLGCALSGCARWVGIRSGEYTVIRGRGEAANEVAMRTIQKLEIDRDERVVVFTLVDGSEITTSFVPRDRAKWPAGCPTNIGSTRMEVLDIQADTLTIESVTFKNPILVRHCSPDPFRVVLREDGAIGGAGGACPGPNETCMHFGPKRDHPWRANDSTVSTHEDTPVTIDITASAEEETGDLDPGTFTIANGPAHGTVVNNLEVIGAITVDTGSNGAGAYTIRIVDLVSYMPNAGFSGTDAFTYRICDMDGHCDTAIVTVTVTPLPSATDTPAPPETLAPSAAPTPSATPLPSQDGTPAAIQWKVRSLLVGPGSPLCPSKDGIIRAHRISPADQR